MRKLRLSIEDLRIDSFDPLGEAGRRLSGTVYGRPDIITDPVSRTQDRSPAPARQAPPVPNAEDVRRHLAPHLQGDSCDICVDPTKETE